MLGKLIWVWVLCGISQLAFGFELVVSGQHATIPPQDVRAMALRVAQSSGHRIPDVPQLKVVVTAKAKLRKQQPGQYLYYHRVQLTKVFAGDPPYPFRGWLPIKSIEFYGVAPAQQLRGKLENALTTFFTQLKNVDPATSAP